jgi:hypothetical protein
MLNLISEKFHSWATGWRVVILLIAEALMAGFVMPAAAGIMALAANNSVLPLDMMFFYTPETAFAMIEKYGPEGRTIYARIELTADLLYPIIYTLFFGLLISWLFQRGFKPESSMQKWNAMPVGAWFFDLLENLGAVAMVNMHPAQPAILAWLTMFSGLVKWAFAVISIGLVLVGLVRALLNGFRKQEASSGAA